MIEYVDKVKMNYSVYSGEDLYTDGDIETELLDIVKNNTDFDSIIYEKKSWPVLYHLSDIRENILSWFPFEKEASVLEIGAGCGAVTGALTDRCKRVVSVDLSKRRSLINAYRHHEADNLEIIVGNFEDAYKIIDEKFDYITLIGVFEYSGLYIHDENAPESFLKMISKLLKPDGKLIIAIENRLGLKYFAGCREDHLGKFFVGIENDYEDNGVCTYSKNELIRIFSNSGYSGWKFYYPYPDYKFPETIYSDERLPQKGELYSNIRNFDSDRYVIFDETKAYDGIIEAGLFGEFSNSFLVVLER
ncbi:MAG: methyltransferase domain-containing protein [Eubacterium sp.]|nr:methyltransferase domain-containing protein [Eubacterium sp.]